MPNYYVDKRYGLSSRRTHLEILPVPDVFLASDFNTNTELFLEFMDSFFKDTFGVVVKSGYEVSLLGNDVIITSGVLWWGKYMMDTPANTQLVNARSFGTTQYVYLKITNTRYTIADDLVSESVIQNVFIRHNIGGMDLSRPNQYIYEGVLGVYNSLQPDSVGNLPDAPDIQYIKLATIESDESITTHVRLFGTALSTLDLDYVNLPLQVSNNISLLATLVAADTVNAKINTNNSFSGLNSHNPTAATYNSGIKQIILGSTNLNNLIISGALVVETLSFQDVGTTIKIKLLGSGSVLFKNSANLLCPGGVDLLVAFDNWVEFTTRVSGVWELTSNSTSNTDILNSQIAIPVGSVIAYEGVMSEFDGTGLGFAGKAGWAICNGQNSTNDMRGKYLVGFKSGDPDFGTMAAIGGSKTVTLGVGELPSHSHTATASNGGTHTHTASETAAGGYAGFNVSSDFAGLHNHSTNSTQGMAKVTGLDTTASPFDSTPLEMDIKHTYALPSDGSHQHVIAIPSKDDHIHTITVVADSVGHTHPIAVSSEGLGNAFSVLNPFYVISWIKRIY